MALTGNAGQLTTCPRCATPMAPGAVFCPECGTRPEGAGIGPVLAGFTILRTIGRGGAAVVYLARQESLQREVAIKVLRREVDDPKVWRSFEREAQTIARLSGNVNVLTVYTAGRSSAGQPYLVTEYMDRGSLADVIAEGGPLSPRALGDIGLAVADALLAAHAVGILHRDVKPANVLLSSRGQVKLGDFGIARLLAGKSETTTDNVAFTPEHVAPEILRGEREGTWSDVYGLASTLVEAATGKPVFRREPDERIESLLSRKLLAPPPTLGPAVPAAIAALLTSALDPAPTQRPDLEEFRRGIAHFASTQAPPAPVGARQTGTTAVAPVIDAAPFASSAATAGVGAAQRPTVVEELAARRKRRSAIAVGMVVAILAIGTLVAVLVHHAGGRGSAAAATTLGTQSSPAAVVVDPGTQTTIAVVNEPAATTAPLTAPPTAAAVVTLSPTTAAPPTSTAATTAPPASTQSTAAATTPVPVPAGPPTASEAVTFVEDYYAAVAAGDYRTSWAELSPQFQSGRAQSYAYYPSFWDKNDVQIRDVRFVSATADETLVDVDLRWNGKGRVQTNRLTLRRSDDGSLLITSETSV